MAHTKCLNATPDDYFCQALNWQQKGHIAAAIRAFFLAGVHWQAQGNHAAALESYCHGLQLDPAQPGVWSNLGLLYQQQRQWLMACQCYQQALHYQADFPEVWNNLGSVQQALGHLAPAVYSYQQCLHFQTDYWQAHLNLGVIYHHIQQFERALAHYQFALKFNPLEPTVYRCLGYFWDQQQQPQAAMACYQEGLRQAGPDPDLLYHLAQRLKYNEQFEQANLYYNQLWQIQPDNPWRRLQSQLYCPPWFNSPFEQQQWYQHLTECFNNHFPLELKQHLDELDVHKVETLGRMVYHGTDVMPLKSAYHQCFTLSSERTLCHSKGAPIRLGFLVTAGHHQIFLHFCKGLIEQFEQTRFVITVICAPEQKEWLTQRLKRPRLEWLVLPLNFAAMIATIQAAHLDILYFWESGTDQVNTFLPHFRLAQVQCTSWGSVATTGNPSMDYYLSSDLIEPPEADRHYSEKLQLVSRLPACFTPPVSPPDRAYSDFGLPADRPLYVCPQNLFKFHPDFDALLGTLLQELPTAQLLVFENLHSDWGTQLRQRWQQVLPHVFHQIRFLPRLNYPDYLALLRLCTAMLDPCHFSGCQTSYEALGLGVPIVTWPGRFAHSRFTTGMYLQMKWTELVAQDAGDYVRLAVRLWQEPTWRQNCQIAIETYSSLLFHDHKAVRELEQVFQQWLMV